MKSRKFVWITALCLLSATVIAVSLRARPTGVLAAQHSVSRASLAQPAAYMSNASLRVAAISNALLSDEAGSAQRVSLNLQRNSGPELPPVEEFTLTPPNPALHITKTTVAVRFPELPAEKLASRIPMTLGDQSVVLQRSADDPRVFSAPVDFDWNAFAKEQERRKELANAGRQIPVFEGHRLVRIENVQFVDPEQIRSAVRSHQSIQFTPQILDGSGDGVTADPELLINDISVVEDRSRTFDPCPVSGGGTPMGAWTFGELMLALSPDGTVGTAEAMLKTWLQTWQNSPQINGFTVNPRPGMGTSTLPGFLSKWPLDSNGLPSLANAPMRLNAIVNRIDLGQTAGIPTAGELRFVFGATGPCPNGVGGGGEAPALLFNVIFEYKVPNFTGCSQVQQWADKWQNLVGDPNLNSDLEAITDSVVGPGVGASNLAAVRTNETALACGNGTCAPDSQAWEERQFQLASGALQEIPIAQTPQGDPTGTNDFNAVTCPLCSDPATLTLWINQNEPEILFPGLYSVPTGFNGLSFQGATAFQPVGTTWWNGSGTINGTQTRSNFSANTCNGCHGRETLTGFQQIVNRTVGGGGSDLPAVLSAFLVGCNTNPLSSACLKANLCPLNQAPLACQEQVEDPTGNGNINTFGDINRRETYMSTVLGGCSSDQLLQSLVRHKVNFVH